jgi:hypothetical protein
MAERFSVLDETVESEFDVRPSDGSDIGLFEQLRINGYSDE